MGYKYYITLSIIIIFCLLFFYIIALYKSKISHKKLLLDKIKVSEFVKNFNIFDAKYRNGIFDISLYNLLYKDSYAISNLMKTYEINDNIQNISVLTDTLKKMKSKNTNSIYVDEFIFVITLCEEHINEKINKHEKRIISPLKLIYFSFYNISSTIAHTLINIFKKNKSDDNNHHIIFIITVGIISFIGSIMGTIEFIKYISSLIF